MYKLEYLVICEDVINGDNAKTSLINIFQVVNSTVVPAVCSRLKVAFRVVPAEPPMGIIKMNISIKSPSGKVVVGADGEIPTTKLVGDKSLSTSVDFSGLVMEEAGKYTVALKVGEKVVGKTYFDFSIQEA